MKERSLLCSPREARAIQEGRQTRLTRLVKPQPAWIEEASAWGWYPKRRLGCDSIHSDWPNCLLSHCPFGVPGDRLIVKETWAARASEDFCLHDLPYRTKGDWIIGDVCLNHMDGVPMEYVYRADGTEKPPFWKPAACMPRYASRLSLEVVSVAVRRVQEISEAEAMAEGVEWYSGVDYGIGHIGSYRAGYCNLWDQIHGHGAWERNDWVRAVTFKRVEKERKEKTV